MITAIGAWRRQASGTAAAMRSTVDSTVTRGPLLSWAWSAALDTSIAAHATASATSPGSGRGSRRTTRTVLVVVRTVIRRTTDQAPPRGGAREPLARRWAAEMAVRTV